MKKDADKVLERQPLAKDIEPEAIPEVPEVKAEPEKEEFSHDALISALYWCLDSFERAGMLFFLVGDTAKHAMRNEELNGDRVDIGVRRLEWESGGKRILDAYISEDYVSEEGDNYLYKHNGIPVYIHVYNEDESISSCDTIVYNYEFFHVPNPYERFDQIYK